MYRFLIFLTLLFPFTLFADNDYDTEFIDLVEIVYGNGYLSQGGPEFVEKMFEGIDLKETKILDLGCGTGGPSLYLAKNYPVTVIGIDPEPLIIDRSQIALQSTSPMKGTASFELMEDPHSKQ